MFEYNTTVEHVLKAALMDFGCLFDFFIFFNTVFAWF